MYSFTYNEVFNAFEDCLKHKKNTSGAVKFCVNKVDNLIRLTNEINNKTYSISKSTAFMIEDPKIREIFAADFRDRIVHHLVIIELYPLFEKFFIKNTFACMKNRGILSGVKTLYNEVKDKSNNYTTPLYLVKLDFKAFFLSIDKYLLYESLDDFIVFNYPNNRKKESLRWLCKIIILHNPQENCIKTGNLKLWSKLPDYKSLFKVPNSKGLAIGNLTSQLFANFYLTFYDKFIINHIKPLLYVRYADDSILGFNDILYAKQSIHTIKYWVIHNLLISIHSNKTYIQECHKGITFIGGVVKPNRVYCSNKSVCKFYKKLHSISNKKEEKVMTSINSYLGLFKHYKTYKIRKKYIKNLTQFKIGKNYYKINKKK